MSNGKGASVRPNRPSNIGWNVSSANEKLKNCRRLTNIRKSSILASCSPMQTLRPGYRKGTSLLLLFSSFVRIIIIRNDQKQLHFIIYLIEQRRFSVNNFPPGSFKFQIEGCWVGDCRHGLQRLTFWPIHQDPAEICFVYGQYHMQWTRWLKHECIL